MSVARAPAALPIAGDSNHGPAGGYCLEAGAEVYHNDDRDFVALARMADLAVYRPAETGFRQELTHATGVDHG